MRFDLLKTFITSLELEFKIYSGTDCKLVASILLYLNLYFSKLVISTVELQ